MNKKYRLNRNHAARYRNKGLLYCQRCGRDLKVGDVVVSKLCGKRSGAKLYHFECAEILLIPYKTSRRS